MSELTQIDQWENEDFMRGYEHAMGLKSFDGICVSECRHILHKNLDIPMTTFFDDMVYALVLTCVEAGVDWNTIQKGRMRYKQLPKILGKTRLHGRILP